MNHAKVNIQKRIAYESRVYDRSPPGSGRSNGERFDRRQEKWLRVPFGKHKGKTLPKIVFEDPGYVVWLYKNDVLLSWLYEGDYPFKLAHQIEVVHNRTTRIKPPAGCEFAIVVDDAGVFAEFITVKRNRHPKAVLKKGWKIAKRLPLLDIGIPSLLNNPKLGFERMRRSMLNAFFGDVTTEPDARSRIEFLQETDNFDLHGVKSNKRLKPGPKDRAALEKKYRRSPIICRAKRNQKRQHK
jgi:hypothetical protein